MVKIIMGLKGSGKTKKLVEMVREAVNLEHGDVVCIEKDKKLTYDIPYRARLIDAAEYGICTYPFLQGFLSGLHAGNYDITHIFIDNFLKLVGDKSMESVGVFLDWADAFAEQNKVEVVISLSADQADATERIQRHII